MCDNTDIAEVFYRRISGATEVERVTEADVAEVLGEEDEANGNGAPKRSKAAKRKKQIVYDKGAIFPEYFSNTPERKRTLRLDTKLLAEAESDDPNKKRQDAAEELRQVVATVGKPGQPGEHVRCATAPPMFSTCTTNMCAWTASHRQRPRPSGAAENGFPGSWTWRGMAVTGGTGTD